MTGPDPDILRRAQAGDREAVAALLEPEMPRVYATCRRMVGRRADAEELAQDALVRIIRGLPTYDGRASFSTWLTRVTINSCLTWLRSKSRQSKHKPVNLEHPDAHLAAPDREPGAGGGVQSSGPRAALVHEALSRIKPEHRAVLVLRDVRGLEYEAIAAALDLAVGTVKSRIFRARAALRGEIEAMERQALEGGPDGQPDGHTPQHESSPGTDRQ